MIVLLGEKNGTVLLLYFTTYLDQEERDAVCPQRPGQLDIFHFCFNLGHFATVLVFLHVGLNMYSVSEQLMHTCQMSVSHKTATCTYLEYFLLRSSLLDVLFGQKLLQAGKEIKHEIWGTGSGFAKIFDVDQHM